MHSGSVGQLRCERGTQMLQQPRLASSRGHGAENWPRQRPPPNSQPADRGPTMPAPRLVSWTKRPISPDASDIVLPSDIRVNHVAIWSPVRWIKLLLTPQATSCLI